MICLCLETLLFSVKLKKINMFGWNQERIFVITNEHIYNIKTSKPKRKIPIHLLGGISKAMTGVKIEFTLHVPTQYDYRFLSEKYLSPIHYNNIYRREEIIDILKHRYAEKMQDNLPIFGIDKSTLTDYTTTEKDMKRMVSRFPPANLRIRTEDLINKSTSQTSSEISGVSSKFTSQSEIEDNTFE